MRKGYPKGNKGLLDVIAARPAIMKGTAIQMMPEVDAAITCLKPPPEMMELVKVEKKRNKETKKQKANLKYAYLKQIETSKEEWECNL